MTTLSHHDGPAMTPPNRRLLKRRLELELSGELAADRVDQLRRTHQVKVRTPFWENASNAVRAIEVSRRWR